MVTSPARCPVSSLPKTPVHLIGFSKGCVVLNQLVHELASVESDQDAQELLSRVTTITWLDGGNNYTYYHFIEEYASLCFTVSVCNHANLCPYKMGMFVTVSLLFFKSQKDGEYFCN
jgi:hypothetical protein